MSEAPLSIVPHRWDPRDYQRPLWLYLERGGLRAEVVAHRRWGKDEVALHWAASCANGRAGAYWRLLPEAAQGRKAIWDAVNPHTGRRRIDEAFPKRTRARTRDAEMMIHFKSGATWQVVGSDNYDSLAGSPPRRRGVFGMVALQARGLDLHPANPGGRRRLGAVPVDARGARTRHRAFEARAAIRHGAR